MWSFECHVQSLTIYLFRLQNVGLALLHVLFSIIKDYLMLLGHFVPWEGISTLFYQFMLHFAAGLRFVA